MNLCSCSLFNPIFLQKYKNKRILDNPNILLFFFLFLSLIIPSNITRRSQQPSLVSSVTHGAHIIEALNMLGVDYGTFGNHEFDYGNESLLNVLAGNSSSIFESAKNSLEHNKKEKTLARLESKYCMEPLTEEQTIILSGETKETIDTDANKQQENETDKVIKKLKDVGVEINVTINSSETKNCFLNFETQGEQNGLFYIYECKKTDDEKMAAFNLSWGDKITMEKNETVLTVQFEFDAIPARFWKKWMLAMEEDPEANDEAILEKLTENAMKSLDRPKEIIFTFTTRDDCDGVEQFLINLSGQSKLWQLPRSETNWVSTNMKYADGDAKDHAIGWSANDININNQIMETALLEWDGVQVGILGVSENWLGSIKDVNIKYENYITAARCAARKLKKNGAEVVLAITHNRLNNDRILTDAVPEIDLLLGGHDHEYTRDRRCRIVKSGQEWKWMSHIKMDFREEGKVPDVSVERYDIEEDIKEDEDMKKLINRVETFRQAQFGILLAGKAFLSLCFFNVCYNIEIHSSH